MASQGTEAEGLADRVCQLYIKSHGFGGRDFLPAGTYKDPTILNAAVVREELDLKLDEDDPLVTFALERAPKIFLTIVSQGWLASQTYRFMRHFMDNDFFDEKLPVDLGFCDSHPAFRLGGWKLAMKRNFSNAQWEHMAPVFSEENFIFRLEPNQPLPFLKPDNGGQKPPEGASSVVHQVKVHEDHLINPPRDVGKPMSGLGG